MAFLVEDPGLWTTIQDRGRTGWQRFGVPVSGAMDEWSFRTANALVGNDDDAAALEIAVVGGTFRVLEPVIIAVCGADLSPTIDGEALPMWRPVKVKAGSRIRFRTAKAGRFAYLSAAGGLDVPEVLGSRSASVSSALPGLAGRTLAAGDRIAVGSQQGRVHLHLEIADGERFAAPPWFVGDEWRVHGEALPGVRTVRAMRGKEWDWFSEEVRQQLIDGQWICTVRAESDRMGYRLSAPPILRDEQREMVSEAVTAGTVQVPPDGQPIVLMADCQTTGGYPRLLQVIHADLGLIAQAQPGEQIRFQLVELDEAVHAFAEREEQLQWLRRRLKWESWGSR